MKAIVSCVALMAGMILNFANRVLDKAEAFSPADLVCQLPGKDAATGTVVVQQAKPEALVQPPKTQPPAPKAEPTPAPQPQPRKILPPETPSVQQAQPQMQLPLILPQSAVIRNVTSSPYQGGGQLAFASGGCHGGGGGGNYYYSSRRLPGLRRRG